MCEPATLATLAIVTSLSGTAVSAAGQSNAAKAQAKTAEANEVLALVEAKEEYKRSNFELYKHGVEMRQAIGTQEAIASGANLALDFGSAHDILSDRFALSARDSITIADNSRARSRALKNSAAVYRSQGRNAATAGDLAVTGTAFSGAGQALTFASQAKSEGIF